MRCCNPQGLSPDEEQSQWTVPRLAKRLGLQAEPWDGRQAAGANSYFFSGTFFLPLFSAM